MATTLNCHGQLLSLETPCVMGILNATPDSFYTKGTNNTPTLLLEQAYKMIQDGAKILDIGGMSSRPGADYISEQEENDRVLPVIEIIKKNIPTSILSIDTFRASVAKNAILAGASMINDISGGEEDSSIIDIAIKYQTPFICMHKKGVPKTMQHNPTYENVIEEILEYFIQKIEYFRQKGLYDVIVDVGFGFGKTLEQNYELLNSLHIYKQLKKPLLVGISRKSMIYKLLNTTPENALNGTTALHSVALAQGCQILRVHDVKEAVECIQLNQFLIQKNKSHFH